MVLNLQYWMVPELCLFPSNEFYNGVLKCAEKVESASYVGQNFTAFFDEYFNGKKLTFLKVKGQ